MNQWEFETIMMVLDGGAPAIADKLAISIQKTIQENEQLRKENETLKVSCECKKSQSESSCECHKAEKKVLKTSK